MSASRPRQLVSDAFATINAVVATRPARLQPREIGTVDQVLTGTADVRHLHRVSAGELLLFSHGLTGMAADIEIGRCGVILLGATHQLSAGDDVRRTHRVVDTPVGEGLLGRIVDPLGRPLDGKARVADAGRWPVERPAPPIIDRAAVDVSLATGIKAIDTAIPIGRGQRQLILGDRQIGKTAVAIDTILNQGADVISVYCAIGQRGDAVAGVIAKLEQAGALGRTIVVVAGGEDAPGLQFIAPYAATSMAEWFMNQGRDVLIVYDDLTRHARAYRELSLLLRRPPAREAYPGDIFYIHSRLLERSTRLRATRGGGSLTALPIIETQAQNISAYIPTNLISITDGQIYLSPSLFHRGQLPAIDIGKSVSRVGGKAQLRALREVAGPLKLAYAQFEELESFARFGTRLDPDTRRRLERGRRVREILRQSESDPRTAADQAIVLHAVTKGLCDVVPVDEVLAVERVIIEAVRSELPQISSAIDRSLPISSHEEAIDVVVRHALARSGFHVRPQD